MHQRWAVPTSFFCAVDATRQAVPHGGETNTIQSGPETRASNEPDAQSQTPSAPQMFRSSTRSTGPSDWPSQTGDLPTSGTGSWCHSSTTTGDRKRPGGREAGIPIASIRVPSIGFTSICSPPVTACAQSGFSGPAATGCLQARRPLEQRPGRVHGRR